MHNSQRDTPEQRFSLLPLAAAIIVLLPFSLTLSWCPDVEGLRVGDISSTILQGKALLRGNYPLWNHSDGIGLPHPYGTSLVYHPIVFLFALLRFDVAILFLYLGHAILGTYSIWYLCGYFQIQKHVKAVCVLTYLMSSPSLNYLVGMDFWPSCVVVWTGIPLLLMLLCKFLDTREELTLRLMVPAIAGLAGFIVINSHLGALTYSMMGLFFFAFANIRKVAYRWQYAVVILLLFALIVSEKLYTTYLEYSRFGLSKRTFQYLPPDLLAMFFWPLKTQSLASMFKGSHYRSFFMGFPFVWLAFAGALWPSRFFRHQRSMAFAALMCLLFLFVPPQRLPGNLVAANYLWRDPLVLFFIILAGQTASLLLEKKGRMGAWARVLLIFQVITLVVGLGPYWFKGLRLGLKHMVGEPSKILRTYTEKGPVIEAIEKHGIRPGRRIVLTDAVQSKLRYYSKVDYTLFRIHQMPLVNGIFKGIDYTEVSPNLKFMYGSIDAKPFSTNKDLLEILGIEYLIAFADETVHKGLQLIEIIETVKGELALYENPDPWQMANLLKSKVLEETDLTQSNSTGLIYRDFSTLKNYRMQGAVTKINRYDNRFQIQIMPASDRSLLFVNSYFRPSWQATGVALNKKVPLKVHSVLGGLIGVDIPPGISDVTLVYRPLARIFLIGISLSALLGCLIVTLLLWQRERVSLRGRIAVRNS